MIPPVLMRLKTGRFGLWVPVIVLWPLLLFLEILLWPVMVLVGLAMIPVKGWGWGKGMILMIPWINGLMCAMRGFSLQVQSGDGRTVDIGFV